MINTMTKSWHGIFSVSWWRHQMETLSALLTIFTGNSPVTQWPVTRSFDVFFDLRLNKRLSKQSRGWWFETLSRPIGRHCNVTSSLWGISTSLRWISPQRGINGELLCFFLWSSFLTHLVVACDLRRRGDHATSSWWNVISCRLKNYRYFDLVSKVEKPLPKPIMT